MNRCFYIGNTFASIVEVKGVDNYHEAKNNWIIS